MTTVTSIEFTTTSGDSSPKTATSASHDTERSIGIFDELFGWNPDDSEMTLAEFLADLQEFYDGDLEESLSDALAYLDANPGSSLVFTVEQNDDGTTEITIEIIPADDADADAIAEAEAINEGLEIVADTLKNTSVPTTQYGMSLGTHNTLIDKINDRTNESVKDESKGSSSKKITFEVKRSPGSETEWSVSEVESGENDGAPVPGEEIPPIAGNVA